MTTMCDIEWHDLTAWAWARRELPAAVDAVLVDKRCFIAGDREGVLECWDISGELLWSSDVGARVEGLVLGASGPDEMLFVSAGLDIVGISMRDGEVVWREELEGSSEAVLFSEQLESVIVTSSVYDIEYHSFMEAACWFFSAAGESLDVQRFEERAWHAGLQDDKVVLGLGRPRNGALLGDVNGFEHYELVDSPVCSGHTSDVATLLGHADGSFTILRGEDSQTMTSGCSTLTAAHLIGEVAVVGDQHGMLAAFDGDSMLWSVDLDDEILALSSVSFDGEDAIWACTRREQQGRLVLICAADGNQLINCVSSSRARCMRAEADNVLLGFEDGTVLLLDMQMLARRISEKPEGQVEDAHRRAMLDRLRNLRG